MKLLLLNGHGINLSVNSSKLVVKNGRFSDDEEPEEFIFRPKRIDVEHIVIYGQNGNISIDAMRWLVKHNVQVTLLDWNGKLLTTMLPPESVTLDIKFAQYQKYQDDKFRVELAKKFIEAKFDKQQTVLNWLKTRYSDINNDLSHYTKKLSSVNAIKDIMLVEGWTASQYWKEFTKIIPTKYEFESRINTNHTFGASDKINAMLNYGYALLEAECLRAINSVGLDRHVGFLHEKKSGKNSLAYDFQELFRYVVDLTIISLIETDSMKNNDFIRTENYSLRLKPSGAKKVISEFNKQLNIKENCSGRQFNRHYIIFLKIREFAHYLIDKKKKLDLATPHIKLTRMDTQALRNKISEITYAQWKNLGMSKGTLHQLKQKVLTGKAFTLNSHIQELLITKF